MTPALFAVPALSGVGEVFVTIAQNGSAYTLLISAETARRWSETLASAAVEAGPGEVTRKACSRCLKDCSTCSCAEDVISKGRSV